jgi:regulator of replication initiation timing
MEIVIAIVSLIVGLAPGALIALLLVQRRIKEADDTAARLRREVAELKAAVNERAAGQAAQQQAELEQLRRDLAAARAESEKQRQDLAVARVENQKLGNELATVRGTLQRTASENDTLRMELLMARSNE